MDISDLPYGVQMELCQILNQEENWKEIACKYKKNFFFSYFCFYLKNTIILPGKYFKIDNFMIKAFARSNNPTEELLEYWKQFNHSVPELFMLFYQMKHYRLMYLLKPLVDKKYHALLVNENLENTTCNLEELGLESNDNRKDKHASPNSLLKSIPKIFSSSLPQIPFNELVKATDDWSVKNFLGKGGFAFVYKGIKLFFIIIFNLSP